MELKPILLVEDNPDDETLTLRTLKKHNIPCEVTVAHDGVEAIDYLFASGAYAGRPPIAPVLILLDLKLPKVDGLEVLRRLRSDRRTRHLPVVVFTSSNEAHDIAESYNLGANSYIRKPVDYGQFSEAVRLIGTYWLIENLPPQSAGTWCL
jgi:two-component system, response regulator